MSSFKKQLFKQFAQVAKALSNGNRLEILEFLAQRECSVEDLAKLTGLSIANTSHHLQQLKHTGLVHTQKNGQYVIYSLASEDVVKLMAELRNVAEQHLDEVHSLVNQYLTVKDDLEPIQASELMDRAKQGLVTVLDVRPPEEYKAGHLPGAVNIPINELKSRLDKLEKDKEIVAYCRGPHCLLAFDAVAMLREHGIDAKRLDGGFPEWKLQGLPVEGNKAS